MVSLLYRVLLVMSAPTDRNISVLSLPIYYILSIIPHAYAIYTASGGNVVKWDNRNPRAGGMKDDLRKRLGDEIYAKYERAEVCGIAFSFLLMQSRSPTTDFARTT